MSARDSKLPIPVRRALLKLGEDICDARRRRRIQVKVMAERASVTRSTLHRVEKGDAGVSMGIYASVLFVLGMLNRLAELADVSQDQLGLALDAEALPKRIRRSTVRGPGTGAVG